MKTSNRTSKAKKEFFCAFAILLFSLASIRANAHTMRAVSPESIQMSAPKSDQVNPKNDEDNSNVEDLDFDDDFSVLV